MNEKKLGILRYAKTGSAAAIVFVVLGFTCCAHRPAVDIWGDAGVVAEQRLVIEQQQRRLNDMGDTIAEISAGLERAIGVVTASLNGVGNIESQFREIDVFVRAVIAGKQRLEELQRADSGTDAGAR